jgi:hypothetical protein
MTKEICGGMGLPDLWRLRNEPSDIVRIGVLMGALIKNNLCTATTQIAPQLNKIAKGNSEALIANWDHLAKQPLNKSQIDVLNSTLQGLLVQHATVEDIKPLVGLFKAQIQTLVELHALRDQRGAAGQKLSPEEKTRLYNSRCFGKSLRDVLVRLSDGNRVMKNKVSSSLQDVILDPMAGNVLKTHVLVMLGEISDKTAIPCIKQLLRENPDTFIQTYGREALERLQKQ